MSLSKFSGPDLDSSVEFTHPDVWSKDVYPGWQRLTFGARAREIDLMLGFCRGMQGPFCVLYVLLVSRTGKPSGRYESASSISYDELELFLCKFQEFLEQDGRHHLGVISTSGEGQFVFDHHNVVYAYGDVDGYERMLRKRGFRKGTLSTPAPHGHNYHPEFDASEADLLAHWPWTRFPLDEDDDP